MFIAAIWCIPLHASQHILRQTDRPLHVQTCVCLQAHMHVSLSSSRLSFLDNSHRDYSSSSTLQRPHAYSAFSNAGEHKILCWCCSRFCVQRYMGTVGWMGLRDGPCYLLAVSWHSLAKLSCTCTASSWKLSDRGERHSHHDVLVMHACMHHSFAKIHSELCRAAAIEMAFNQFDGCQHYVVRAQPFSKVCM